MKLSPRVCGKAAPALWMQCECETIEMFIEPVRVGLEDGMARLKWDLVIPGSIKPLCSVNPKGDCASLSSLLSALCSQLGTATKPHQNL